jgi:translation initiation factor 3 subunit L
MSVVSMLDTITVRFFRFESYYNYCNLFNCILSPDKPVVLDLPNQWLWEIIDEFIYQFQSFQQFRAKLQKKSDEEIEILKHNLRTWDVLQVLNVLHSMVDKSNINKQLEVYTAGGNPDTVAGDFGRHPLYKMMGYFSLVGLLRLHSLLGDFHQVNNSKEPFCPCLNDIQGRQLISKCLPFI